MFVLCVSAYKYVGVLRAAVLIYCVCVEMFIKILYLLVWIETDNYKA